MEKDEVKEDLIYRTCISLGNLVGCTHQCWWRWPVPLQTILTISERSWEMEKVSEDWKEANITVSYLWDSACIQAHGGHSLIPFWSTQKTQPTMKGRFQKKITLMIRNTLFNLKQILMHTGAIETLYPF